MKMAIKILVSIFIVIVIVLIGYIIYLSVTDYKPNEEEKINIENNNISIVNLNKEMTFITANIGFGAYDSKFDFFMDKGSKSRGASKENIETNVNGIMESIKIYDPSFVFFQEVDKNSTRSYYVDQYDIIKNLFKEYNSSFCINFKNPWINYPFLKPHGKVEAGQVTLSKFFVENATRRALPIDESWPYKLFSLDRCALISRIPVENGKELVLLNVHLSAYDKGGIIRKKQLQQLQTILEKEILKGNYVVMGGDFNHQIPGSHPENFKSKEKWPDWLQPIPDEFKPKNFKWFFDDKTPTCRTAGKPYEEGYNFLSIIDGFMVSDNIQVIKTQGINNNFKYSDHNPVSITIKLK